MRNRVRSLVERFARSFVSFGRPQVFLFERSSSVHLLVRAYVPTLFCAHLEDRQVLSESTGLSNFPILTLQSREAVSLLFH